MSQYNYAKSFLQYNFKQNIVEVILPSYMKRRQDYMATLLDYDNKKLTGQRDLKRMLAIDSTSDVNTF